MNAKLINLARRLLKFPTGVAAALINGNGPNQARGVDCAADDEAAGYPVFCDDRIREFVQHPPRGHQQRNHSSARY